jgi:hypothetical protein
MASENSVRLYVAKPPKIHIDPSKYEFCGVIATVIDQNPIVPTIPTLAPTTTTLVPTTTTRCDG